MRIAITGGSGFVGRHLAARLRADGHDVVVIGRPRRRSKDRPDASDRRAESKAGLVEAEIDDAAALALAFGGCDAVVHCAGINREIGDQTYTRVHVAGTAAVVRASQDAGVRQLVMLSFLRARPDAPSSYHRTKWTAEEAVRGSGLAWTVVKASMIYGLGDHMLDHLSKAVQTFPIFALVGFRDRPARPVAVADVVSVLATAAYGDARLAHRTVAVLGPETLYLGEIVRRVATVVRRRVIIIRLPVAAHLLIGWLAERLMVVPLVALAQVRILAEGVTEPAPFADDLPPDLAPATHLTDAVIRAELPPRGGFGRSDLRWFARG